MEVIKKSSASGIFWDVVPKLVDGGGDGMLVELQWGWDAWATPEQLANRAEDCPSGFGSVEMTVEQARDLRDALTEIVESPEAATITEEHAATLRRIDELSRRLTAKETDDE